MTKTRTILTAITLAMAGFCPAPAQEPTAPARRTVEGIHVSTDRSVDFFSRETTLKSIIKPGMSNEEQAIACWRLVNRRIFHFCRPDDNDPMRVLNVYGYALCGTIQHTLVWLVQGAMGPEAAGHAGLSSREIEDPETYRIAAGGWLLDSMVRLDAGKPPTKMGHTWCQLFYDGRQHYLDAHSGFYVYTADGKGIASVADISGDPTLVTDPVRKSEPFMPCDAGRPEFFYRCAGGGFDKGVEKTAHSMALRVRPGESLVFHFDKLPGGFFKRSKSWEKEWSPDFYGEGPHHRCAGGQEKAWRHYGNGEILFAPDLAKAGFREALADSSNLACQAEDRRPGLHPADPAKPARAVFEFASPYVMVGGSVEAEFLMPAGTSAKLSLIPPGNQAKAQLVAEARGRGSKELVQARLDMDAAGYPYSARVQVELTGGGSVAPALTALRIRLVTQLNFGTLPRPLPGANKIRVECGSAPAPASPLFVEWAWTEKGGKAMSDRRAVNGADFGYDLGLGATETQPEENPKYMRWLKLEMPDQ
jgi:hypothetical protein